MCMASQLDWLILFLLLTTSVARKGLHQLCSYIRILVCWIVTKKSQSVVFKVIHICFKKQSLPPDSLYLMCRYRPEGYFSIKSGLLRWVKKVFSLVLITWLLVFKNVQSNNHPIRKLYTNHRGCHLAFVPFIFVQGRGTASLFSPRQNLTLVNWMDRSLCTPPFSPALWMKYNYTDDHHILINTSNQLKTITYNII